MSIELPGNVSDRPLLRVLTDEKIERIHEATLEILETVGVKVSRASAREMMADAGCSVDDDIVKVPRKLVEDSLASAPKRVTVYNREGEEALYLGSDAGYTNTGYTPLEFFDIDTGERRDYTLDDFRLVARVADALPNVDVIGQPGVVRPTAENPLEVINHLEFEAMLTNTSKPLYALVADGPILSDCYDMAEAVAVANGAKDLGERPFVLPMLNPISPLVYHDDTIDKLIVSVDRGAPVICGPMPISGGTAPATMAGTIALSNAESLFGLVMSQVRRKGAPYVMITFAATMDMQTGDVAFGPEVALLHGACLEMGHHYGVPISGGWAAGGFRGTLDSESGLYQMMGAMLTALSGGNAGIGVGGGSSIEACVLSDEVIGMMSGLVKGVAVDDDSLAVDVIRDIGPGGGTFLGHPHTFRHFKDYWRPTLIPRQSYEDWEADGKKTAMDRVQTRLREIMSTHQPKPIPESAKPKIAEIIQRARERVAVAV